MSQHRMTEAQRKYYQMGYDDRMADRRMRETFDMQPHVSNAYINGYRAACERAQ